MNEEHGDKNVKTEHEAKLHHVEHQHKENADKNGVSVSKINLWKSISAILAVLFVISILTHGFALKKESCEVSITNPGNAGDTLNAQEAQPSAKGPEPSAATTYLMDDDAVKGDPNAPVTIVEWSDYQCPFCQRFYEQTMPSIEKEYIDTGKVRFVYRDFPLSFHENAQKAAEAAECAGEQGKYYEMYDKLFTEGVSGGVNSFKSYAAGLGLDTGEFNQCLDSGKMAAETAKDEKDGQDAGVTGTPAFMINGKLIVGAQPFSVFKQAIDDELAKLG